MAKYVMALDAGTTSNRCILFNEKGEMCSVAQREFTQYFPKPGWVEHDADEIWASMLGVAVEAMNMIGAEAEDIAAIGITNQRETTIVWDKETGEPIHHAIVWQCRRTSEYCDSLKEKGLTDKFREKTGLVIDAYFSGTKVKWLLDNVPGARERAEKGELLFGTVETWLIWKLTKGAVHVTDYSNASRTMLFNVHTLAWDKDLMSMLDVPESMAPQALPSDAVFGTTDAEGIFREPVQIAGVLGDSHGALAGQMCFGEGQGKVTYGTGSSVMVNIGENAAKAPAGMVTSVGFSALGKTFYAFEGNIHCTGATIAWLQRELKLINNAAEIEGFATSVPDNGGVYFIPAFAGLGAPWWNSAVRARIVGMTLGTGKAHVCRAALESIGYQVTDLVEAMTSEAGISLKELRVDGGPTRNRFLMQFQSDLLGVPVVRSEAEDASAFGAFVMNGFARKKWLTFDEAAGTRVCDVPVVPGDGRNSAKMAYAGWREAVEELVRKY